MNDLCGLEWRDVYYQLNQQLIYNPNFRAMPLPFDFLINVSLHIIITIIDFKK
jgi:hypothetical protein